MRALIRRSLRHVNLVATLFLVLAGTSFAIAQESVDPSGSAAEEIAGPGDGDGGADTGDGSDGGSSQGDGEGEDGSDQGDSEPDGNGNGGGDGSDSDGGEAQPGPLGVTVREGDEVQADVDTPEVQATARCQDGEALTGGGVRTVDPTRGAKATVQASHPSPDDPSQWQATVLNSTGNGSLTVVAYAICAAQQP